MVRDWVANRNGSPMQIVAVDEDNAYACESNEKGPWIFGDDEGYKPQLIMLTPEILEKNGFAQDDAYTDAIADGCFAEFLVWHYYANEVIVSYDSSEELVISNNVGYPCSEITLYRPKVHELQHALRLCGLNELADNFKV